MSSLALIGEHWVEVDQEIARLEVRIADARTRRRALRAQIRAEIYGAQADSATLDNGARWVAGRKGYTLSRLPAPPPGGGDGA